MAWLKPAKPLWLELETYDRLPAPLEIRELQVSVDIPGFRSQSLVVVTS